MSDPEKTEFFEGRARLIKLPKQVEPRGSLVPFNFEQLPFPPHHAFTVQGVPAGVVRGQHARRSVQQLLVCLAGQLQVELRDSGRSETITLDRPDIGLSIGENLWAAQTYLGPETILLVFTSAPYEAGSYGEEPPN